MPSRQPDASVILSGGVMLGCTWGRDFRHFFSCPAIEISLHPLCFQLVITAERVATMKDVMQDWRRHFVLFADWLHALPEFASLSVDDQVCTPHADPRESNNINLYQYQI